MSDTLAPTAAFLLATLPFPRPTTIVDVGANPINEAPYSALLRAGGCHVVGFEPQPSAYAELQKIKSDRETYHPFAVGDGSAMELKVYRSSGMTSVFAPYLPGFHAIGQPGWAKVVETLQFDTVALDQAPDLQPFDLLKIDIQGGENFVFRGAERVMAAAVCVIVELRYMRLYEGEPMMGGVDEELRRQGFYLHKFMFNKSKMMPNSQAKRLRPKRIQDQLVDGDGVYIRNPGDIAAYDVGQLMHLALLAASVFESHSLALYCLDELVKRGVIAADVPSLYVDQMPMELRSV